MSSVSSLVDVNEPVGDEQRRQIGRMNNNALIIRLHFTINHLSRWLSPIHDANLLERSLYRGEPTVKDLVIALRDEEHRIFPKMHLISVRTNPDLDTLAPYVSTAERRVRDREEATIVLMAQFRRLRQSTCSLLRSLPDDAWERRGSSRREHNTTIRELAEGLTLHDYQVLRAVDQTLDAVGARNGLAEIQKVHLDELLKLVPEQLHI